VTLAEIFAANLRHQRKLAGLSQEELAERSSIHRSQISLLEKGNRLPRLESLVKLAGGLGVGVDVLLDGITWEPVKIISGGLRLRPSSGDWPE